MKLRFYLFGLALAVVSLGRASPPADSVAHGKIMRIETATCIAFDVEELLHRDGTPSTFVIAAVWVSPTPESKILVSVPSSLIGATVSGITITTKGWHVLIEVSRLAVTPKGAAEPYTNGDLAFVLRVETEAGISAGIRYGKLTPDTPVPAVAAAGIDSGTVSVISGGPDATPVMHLTAEQLAREVEKRSAESKSAGAR